MNIIKGKILTWIVVVLSIVLVGLLFFYFKSSPNNQEVNKPEQEKNKEVSDVTQEDLDKSIISAMEALETTCTDFLKGDLSGDPDFDCPAFDEMINKDLCFYCYSVKKSDPNLCEKIKFHMSFKTICQKATEAFVNK